MYQRRAGDGSNEGEAVAGRMVGVDHERRGAQGKRDGPGVALVVVGVSWQAATGLEKARGPAVRGGLAVNHGCPDAGQRPRTG